MNTFISRGMFLPAASTLDFGRKQGELKRQIWKIVFFPWLWSGSNMQTSDCRTGHTTDQLKSWHRGTSYFATSKHVTSLLVLFRTMLFSYRTDLWWKIMDILTCSATPQPHWRGTECEHQFPLQPACAASEWEKPNELKKLTAAWALGEESMSLSNKLIHYIDQCLNLFLLRQTSTCIK